MNIDSVREDSLPYIHAFITDDNSGPIPIPKTYEEAMASRWKHKWEEAMRKEMEGLLENGT